MPFCFQNEALFSKSNRYYTFFLTTVTSAIFIHFPCPCSCPFPWSSICLNTADILKWITKKIAFRKVFSLLALHYSFTAPSLEKATLFGKSLLWHHCLELCFLKDTWFPLFVSLSACKLKLTDMVLRIYAQKIVSQRSIPLTPLNNLSVKVHTRCARHVWLLALKERLKGVSRGQVCMAFNYATSTNLWWTIDLFSFRIQPSVPHDRSHNCSLLHIRLARKQK